MTVSDFLRRSRCLCSCIVLWAALLALSCRSAVPPLLPDTEVEVEVLTETDEEEELFEEVAIPPYTGTLPVSSFGEIWAYLLSGREGTLNNAYPVSDVGYFGAEIDSYGKLTGVPNRRNISRYTGRVHMIVACNSRSLTHFVLEEGSALRRELVDDLLLAAKPYDGLQIDFEMIPARDGETFRSFLAELKNGLEGRMLTVALPARNRTIQNDVYDYAKIRPLVDRILVMAYDEHWSSSAPGPIASMRWCRAVASYAFDVVGPEKLIMGLPFYGRAWGDTNPSRAYMFSGIERIKRENNISEVQRSDGIPTFTYEIPVSVTVFYEDDFSLSVRMEMYRSMNVRAIGFWCLGQESPTVWNILELK
ncbi:MAG: glycoside hydrolase [Spirochaetaceae bacterium]|nr:glycoside hydrolase [Spirochaetaceae bacterium]